MWSKNQQPSACTDIDYFTFYLLYNRFTYRMDRLREYISSGEDVSVNTVIILRNDDSIHQYIWPRTTVFTLLSCQLLSMCHFSTVYPQGIFQYVGGYIVLKSILVLCTPYVLKNTWGGRQYCSKVDMITMLITEASKKKEPFCLVNLS
jgi:hypothetical protein